ncbi:MAG: hypothetical protein AB7V46_20070 [Thermomicrobiales bacterium]
MVTDTRELMGSDSISVDVEDFTGSVRRRASGIPKDATVAELVNSLAEQLHLEQQDANGRPVIYGAQSADGFVLNPSDRVGDVLRQDEVVRLTKSVTAG